MQRHNITFGQLIKTTSYLLFLSVVSLTGLFPVATQALTNNQLKVYQRGVNYFDYEVAQAQCASTGTTTLTGNSNEEKAFNYFIGKGLTPPQSAGIVGNMIIESAGVNPAIQQDGSSTPYPKNGVGFGISQWTFTVRQQPLVDLAHKENQPVNTLPPQLDYVWQELTTDYSSVLSKLKATTTVQGATAVIMNDYEAPAERVQNLILRTQAAQMILSRYGSNLAATTTSTTPVSGCATGPSAVTGNIVQTALNLAWNTKGHGYNEADAKPTYQVAMPQYNGSTGQFPYSDCGVFIATVMIASGADPNYVKRGTTLQLNYMVAHPLLYQEIPDVSDSSHLIPGDILVSTDHTYMYVGNQPNGYNSVAASLHISNGGHVPQPDNWYPGFRAFRLIKNAANPATGGGA